MEYQQAPQAPQVPKQTSEWDEAREWFNKMETSSRNSLILTMYRLCMSTKEISHKKLAESLNAQWTEKLNESYESQRKLQMMNQVLRENQQQHIGTLNETIRHLEAKMNESVNAISLKITPSSNGKLGENYIETLLGSVPNSKLSNVSQSKGGGDFLYEQEDTRIMIESKNWTNSSIKGNPKELENFRKTAIASKEEGKIDFAIMALHRVTDMKGNAISMETVYTKKGRLMLIFVTNLFNHPDRLLYAIDAGFLLLKQQSQSAIDADKFLYQVDVFMKSIERVESSIKERTKLIKSLLDIARKDTDQVSILRQSLENIINDSDELPLKDRVINFCWELITQNGGDDSKVTKSMLEARLLENKIPARWVREFGGIKAIKKLAHEKNKEIASESSNESVRSETTKDGIVIKV